MNTQYKIDEWASETTRGRHVFNYNYRMFGNELRGWNLVKVVTMQEDRETTEKVYIWQRKSNQAGELVRVSVTERYDWRLAHESLNNHLSFSMRPDIPRGTNTLVELGDVNFVSREAQTDIPAAIFFTRGNVCITVTSIGEINIDVSNIAARVDHALNDPPTKAELEKGQARSRSLGLATVKPDKTQLIIKDLKKTTPRNAWLKVIAPDGEISQKGNTLNFTSSQSGKRQINTYTMRGT